jgi:hypothetical protein
MYSSTLSLTSVVGGVGGQGHARENLNSGGKKRPYWVYGRSFGPRSRSGRVWKISPPPGGITRKNIISKISNTFMTKNNRENALNSTSFSRLKAPFFLD